jgi:predicted GIY-YIG superfamily endonuclease
MYMPYLYKITCPDECFYIGKAKEPNKRFKQHYSMKGGSPDSFDAYIKKFPLEELKLEILRECPEETIEKEEMEEIVRAKYDLKTGKANPKNLNLMVHHGYIQKLAGVERKPYWNSGDDGNLFLSDKFVGTEYKFLLEQAVIYAKSKIDKSNISRHADLYICPYCNGYFSQMADHITCTLESHKPVIDAYVNEFILANKKNLRQYLKAFKEYREYIQFRIQEKQTVINQWKANLEMFSVSVYDPKK